MAIWMPMAGSLIKANVIRIAVRQWKAQRQITHRAADCSVISYSHETALHAAFCIIHDIPILAIHRIGMAIRMLPVFFVF